MIQQTYLRSQLVSFDTISVLPIMPAELWGRYLSTHNRSACCCSCAALDALDALGPGREAKGLPPLLLLLFCAPVYVAVRTGAAPLAAAPLRAKGLGGRPALLVVACVVTPLLSAVAMLD
jgi:hypothetical protein